LKREPSQKVPTLTWSQIWVVTKIMRSWIQASEMSLISPAESSIKLLSLTYFSVSFVNQINADDPPQRKLEAAEHL